MLFQCWASGPVTVGQHQNNIGSGPVFSYKLRYIVGSGLVEMAISTNPKPTMYRNVYENTGPGVYIYIRLTVDFCVFLRLVSTASTGGSRWSWSRWAAPWRATGMSHVLTDGDGSQSPRTEADVTAASDIRTSIVSESHRSRWLYQLPLLNHGKKSIFKSEVV